MGILYEFPVKLVLEEAGSPEEINWNFRELGRTLIYKINYYPNNMSGKKLPGDFILKLQADGASQELIGVLNSPSRLNISPNTAEELKQVIEDYGKDVDYLNSLRERYNL